MNIRYAHTNIVSRDFRNLADFYIKAFDCQMHGKESKLRGDWLARGTGVEEANLQGVTLRMPGYETNAPTLEIFQYEENLARSAQPAANREGLGHLAFEVDDVEATMQKVLTHSGSKLGEIAAKDFKSGTLTFVYVTDPEGNIIELMHWQAK